MEARLFHGLLVLLVEAWVICEDGGVHQGIDIRHDSEWCETAKYIDLLL